MICVSVIQRNHNTVC